MPMVEFRGEILYRDGRTVEVRGGLPAVAAWEEYAHRNGFPTDLDAAPKSLANLVVLHALVGAEEGFEVWRQTVANFTLESDVVNPSSEGLSAVS